MSQTSNNEDIQWLIGYLKRYPLFTSREKVVFEQIMDGRLRGKEAQRQGRLAMRRARQRARRLARRLETALMNA